MTTRTLLWQGHDDEGNSVVGELPVTVTRPVHTCPIDPTHGRDIANELHEWLDSLPDGVIADLSAGGDPDASRYRAETPIRLDGKVGMTVRGGTLVRTDREAHGGVVYPKPNPHLWFWEPTDCHVENLTVRGTNDVADQKSAFGAYKVDYEFEAAVRMDRFTNCSVTGLDADAIWGDGVQWQVGRGTYIADSRIDRVGRQGVTTICSDFLAERVRVEHGRRSGFDFEPDHAGQVCENFEVRDCYTYTIGLPFASQGSGRVDNVWLHHNVSEGSSVPILAVRSSDGSRRSGWTLEDHTSLSTGLGSPAEAIRFRDVDNIAVRRVNVPISTRQSQQVLGLTRCGGTIEVSDSNFGAGGLYYFNREPMADQQLTLVGNTPTLTEVA